MNIEMGIAPKVEFVKTRVTKGHFTGEYTKAVDQLDKGDTLTISVVDLPYKVTLSERQRLKYACRSVEKNSKKIFSIHLSGKSIVVKRHL